MADIEDQLRQLEGQYSDSDEDSCQGDFQDQQFESQDEEDLEQLIDDLYCVACDKLFKTAGARDNHETSKKHRENMEKLVKEMKEEEEEEEANLSEDNSGDGDSEGPETLKIPQQSSKGKSKKQKKKQKKNQQEKEEEANLSDENSVDGDGEEPESVEIPQQSSKGKSKKQKKKQKKNQQVASVEKSSDSEAEKPVPNSVDDNFSSDDEDRKRNKKGKKKNKKSKLPSPTVESLISDNIEVTESHSAANNEKIIETPAEENIGINEVKKSKKAKSKKGNNLKNENDEDVDLISKNDLTCAQCKGNFPSKNKLFDHLKKTGHAVYLPPTNGVQESNKKKKKK